MTEDENRKLDLVFHALSDSTRRRMLELLLADEQTITQLAAPFAMTMPAILKHLRVLSDAGLVEHHKTGRVRHCRLEEGPINEATVWLSKQSKYWQSQFEMLALFLSSQPPTEINKGEKDELRFKTRATQAPTRPSYRSAQKNDRPTKIPRARKS